MGINKPGICHQVADMRNKFVKMNARMMIVYEWGNPAETGNACIL